ncbi:D-alanyl-D-alanine carboxypeptidase family protein [Saccharopolyspora dendranthemae]|uniref:D-alanyl-D-alanine carboxypeptidase (Penicillin-binding protein 5/6) n=1 Tax=Saccharopolyspora dendranthemae TaxID=1181886 RepID=A0A561U0K4_9PSEU|nr:D-alanyl-D-alanine carboxypeptidase family protein [Saccharopolyspora dendranthemae]TWF92895.1 D-alanyl-D-alanine carboxypeptidase (penicillin-binding protein 5/6) [Saccharopolyspora dendranthemae]
MLVALPLLTAAPAAAQPPACPNAEAPPPAVDTSEVPAPGQPAPTPVPVPETPVGGDRIADCALLTAPDRTGPPPDVAASAAGWVLADLDSGEILAAKDAHARQRPASTIKVLTALTALRELKLDDTLVATQEDANQEGTRIGLLPGMTYRVGDVFQAMLMGSGNDAAHALAMKMGGVPATLEKMNHLAAEIGALDTRAATPSGLDGPGMSTSAYDLATIFRLAMREPAFANAIATPMMLLPGAPGQPPFELWSDNQVLRNYPGGLGGKTGFTDDARHTFIGSAQRDGRRLVAVMMRGENTPVRLSHQAMALLDHGFSLPGGTSVGQLVTTSPRAPEAAVPAARAGVPPEAQGVGVRDSSFFGTITGPLILLAIALVAVATAVLLRRRRAQLAQARRQASAESAEHP